MALIALITANKVNIVGETRHQHTSPAAEAITAGAPVIFDANGKFVNSASNTTGLKNAWGVAARTVAAGEALTAVRSGNMDGWDLSGLAYGAQVFVSDTSGRLGDAAGTTTTVVGHVIPGWAVPNGTAADKILCVACTGSVSQ